jgi:formylglycine-generating enzyme required for sulfatase activity
VKVSAFALDLSEVTVEAYAACVTAGKCKPTESFGPEDGMGPGLANEPVLCNWGANGKGNHPIHCVGPKQAVAFCQWLGKRLPTPEEFAWVLRGQTQGSVYPWGAAPAVGRACWKRADKGTCPVGSNPSGDAAGGFHDVVGNVAEWTSKTVTYPPFADPSIVQKRRVICGGSYLEEYSEAAQSCTEGSEEPCSRCMPAWKRSDVGFRCAR